MQYTKLSTFIAVCALLGSSNVKAQDEEPIVYDYNANGADWPDKFKQCSKKNQSPIDLKSKGLPIVSELNDQFNKLYTNQVGNADGDIQISWLDGKNFEVNVNKPGQDTQIFSSSYSKDRMGATDIYNGQKFNIRAQSEHTINGEHFDLELQSFHEAKETIQGISNAALSILFSVDRYTARISEEDTQIIDDFFDSLRFDDFENPLVPLVPYGDLMMMIDTKYRWVYKGSMTTPPCDAFVYWNVLKTVYPIKQRHLDGFNAQLARGEGNLLETGNWRSVTEVDLHNPVIIMQQSGKVGIQDWDYSMLGADWPERYPECDTDQQSPIDLLSPITAYGQSYDIYDVAIDKVALQYWDMINPQIHLDRNTKQVNCLIDDTNGYAGFQSKISEDVFESIAKWDAFKFLMHVKSEHTIDGQRFDLELQIQHKPNDPSNSVEGVEEEFSYESADAKKKQAGRRLMAAESDEPDVVDSGAGDYYKSTVAILFSVDNYDEIADEDAQVFYDFFADLQLSVDDPVVDTVRFGAMMNTVDFDNRWMYKGSGTAPPCNQFVLWNVIKKVYPVKQIDIDQFMNKMEKVGASQGNYRVVQNRFNPDVAFVSSGSIRMVASTLSAVALGALAYLQ